MAKLIKIEGYLCDANGMIPDGEYLKSYLSDMIYNIDLFAPVPFKIKESNDFEWYDEIDLNYHECTEEDCEKYFK